MYRHVYIYAYWKGPLMGLGWLFLTDSPSLQYGPWGSTQGTKEHKLGASWMEANVDTSGPWLRTFVDILSHLLPSPEGRKKKNRGGKGGKP